MILYKLKQEARLMLTNPRDAFRGQSMAPNMVPMSGMVSYYCATETLSLIRAIFLIFEFKKCPDLEIRVVRGHFRSLKVFLFNRLGVVFCYCPTS